MVPLTIIFAHADNGQGRKTYRTRKNVATIKIQTIGFHSVHHLAHLSRTVARAHTHTHTLDFTVCRLYLRILQARAGKNHGFLKNFVFCFFYVFFWFLRFSFRNARSNIIRLRSMQTDTITDCTAQSQQVQDR
jgi:hypothetical protein